MSAGDGEQVVRFRRDYDLWPEVLAEYTFCQRAEIVCQDGSAYIPAFLLHYVSPFAASSFQDRGDKCECEFQIILADRVVQTVQHVIDLICVGSTTLSNTEEAANIFDVIKALRIPCIDIFGLRLKNVCESEESSSEGTDDPSSEDQNGEIITIDLDDSHDDVNIPSSISTRKSNQRECSNSSKPVVRNISSQNESSEESDDLDSATLPETRRSESHGSVRTRGLPARSVTRRRKSDARRLSLRKRKPVNYRDRESEDDCGSPVPKRRSFENSSQRKHTASAERNRANRVNKNRVMEMPNEEHSSNILPSDGCLNSEINRQNNSSTQRRRHSRISPQTTPSSSVVSDATDSTVRMGSSELSRADLEMDLYQIQNVDGGVPTDTTFPVHMEHMLDENHEESIVDTEDDQLIDSESDSSQTESNLSGNSSPDTSTVTMITLSTHEVSTQSLSAQPIPPVEFVQPHDDENDDSMSVPRISQVISTVTTMDASSTPGTQKETLPLSSQPVSTIDFIQFHSVDDSSPIPITNDESKTMTMSAPVIPPVPATVTMPDASPSVNQNFFISAPRSAWMTNQAQAYQSINRLYSGTLMTDALTSYPVTENVRSSLPPVPAMPIPTVEFAHVHTENFLPAVPIRNEESDAMSMPIPTIRQDSETTTTSTPMSTWMRIQNQHHESVSPPPPPPTPRTFLQQALTCNCCSRQFPTLTQVTDCIQAHGEYRCNFCLIMFEGLGDLLVHLNANVKNSSLCPVCQEVNVFHVDDSSSHMVECIEEHSNQSTIPPAEIEVECGNTTTASGNEESDSEVVIVGEIVTIEN